MSDTDRKSTSQIQTTGRGKAAPRASTAPSLSRWPRRLAVLLTLLVAAGVVLYLIPADLHITGHGNVMAGEDAVIRPAVSAAVVEVFVRTADPVERGQLLVQLDDSEQRAALARVEHQLAESQAEYARLEAQLEVQRGERRAHVAVASLELNIAENELAPFTGLVQSGAASARERERAQLAVDLAQARLQEASLDREPLWQAQLDVLRRRVETLHAERQIAAEQVRLRKVVSPITGRIVLHEVSLGQVVSANEVLGQVFNETEYVLMARVAEANLWFLRPGQRVQAEVTPYPHRSFGYLDGHTKWISSTVNPHASGDGTVTLCVAIAPPARDDVQLRPGMTGQVRVHVGRTRLLWRMLPIRTYDLLPS